MEKIKLFCFPYAGSSAVVYKEWKQFMNPSIELVAVELAGRGVRIQEEPYQDVASAVNDIMRLIRQDIMAVPYALFGHSMGSLLCYELVHQIIAEDLPLPAHIFFSGRGAPHISRPDKKKYHLLNEADFRASVLQLGGTPVEFFEYPELMNLFLPILKNDFKIIETAGKKESIVPIAVDISVLFGKGDDLLPEQIEEWKKHSFKSCRIHQFEGGHFFLRAEVKSIASIINDTLVNNN